MTVIPIELLVRIVAIVVSQRVLATLQADLGVALLLEQILKLIFILDGGADPYLFVVDADADSADGDVHFVSSQPRDDLQQGLRDAE